MNSDINSQEISKCPQCNSSIGALHLYCTNCGSKVAKTCHCCDQRVASNVIFCSYCGDYVIDEDDPDDPKPTSKTPYSKWISFEIILQLVFGILLLIFFFWFMKSFSFWYFFAFFAFLYINIYIHETGHALAGVMVNFSIRRIQIGTGRRRLRIPIGKFLLILTNNIKAGFTYLGDVPGKFLKTRYVIFALGGILAQIFCILIVSYSLNISISDKVLLQEMSMGFLFIFTNIYLIVYNIIPHYVSFSGIMLPTDGMVILKVLFLKDDDFQEILGAGKMMDGFEFYESKQFPEAEIVFKEHLENFPKSMHALLNYCSVLLKQLKFKEAQLVLEKAQENYKDSFYAAILYNFLAWTCFMQFDDKLLAKVDAFSQKAFEISPHNHAILSTRGCALIQQGQLRKGLRLLYKTTNLQKAIDEGRNSPSNFLFMAYGLFLNGEKYFALKYIDKLEKSNIALDPDDKVLQEYVIEQTANFDRPGK